MRIGELAQAVGVTADTIRFYERSALLPGPARHPNGYRDYDESDAEHLRLLIDLRRLDLPLDDAARMAAWCHSGHCAEASSALPDLIAERRSAIAERIAGLAELDARLAGLERHLLRPAGNPRTLSVLGDAGPCCATAVAVGESAAGGCSCCGVATETAATAIPSVV